MIGAVDGEVVDVGDVVMGEVDGDVVAVGLLVGQFVSGVTVTGVPVGL